MGKSKPALGSFLIKHRNITWKPINNSNTTRVGANTQCGKFNLNLCHALMAYAAACFVNSRRISLAMIIKTNFFIIYLFHLIPVIVQTTQLYFLADALRQCWVTRTNLLTWFPTSSFYFRGKKEKSHPLTLMLICPKSATIPSNSPAAHWKPAAKGSPLHKFQVSKDSHPLSRHFSTFPHIYRQLVTFALS